MKEFRDRLDPAGWKRSGKICIENIGLEQDLQECMELGDKKEGFRAK